MNSNQTQQSMELRDYFKILKRRKYLLIFPFIITVLAVVAGSYYLKPVYESSTTILVGETNFLSATFSRIVPGEERGRGYDNRQEQLNTIRNRILSTSYLQQLIDKLDIPISEDIKRKVTKIHKEFPNISELELARRIQIDRIRNQIRVDFNGSDLISITSQSSSPKTAADMAKNLADIFIKESLANELVGVVGATEFSDEMLAVYRKRLRQSEDDLRKFQQRMLTQSSDRDSTVNGKLNEINSAIDGAEIEIGTVSQKLHNLKTYFKAQGIKDYNIRYSDSLNTMKFEALTSIQGLKELLGKYSWKDGKVVLLNQKSRLLLESIKFEIDKLVRKQYRKYNPTTQQKIADNEYLTIKLSYLREREKALKAAAEKIKSDIALTPSLRQEQERLQRKVDDNRRIYELFSEQLAGSQINQAATRASAETKFKIIEPADIPIKPVSPNRVKLTILGAILGLGLGFGAVLSAEFLDNSFHKVEEVESYLGIRVIGTIPKMDIPFSQKGAGRIWVIFGMAITLLLIAAVVYLNQLN